MYFPKLEARGVNSYGELRKLTFSEGPLKYLKSVIYNWFNIVHGPDRPPPPCSTGTY